MTQSNSPVPPPPPKQTSKYSGAIKFMIGLDVLLVVVAIIVGINTFSDPKAPDSSAVSGSASEAQQEDPAQREPEADTEEQEPSQEMTGVKLFASPSGNITCEISAVGARCDIINIDASVQENEGGCEGTIGHVVTLTAQGTDLPCVAPQDGPHQPTTDYQELDYGQDLWVNNYQCKSERSGITCTDITTNRGFTLARAGIDTF